MEKSEKKQVCATCGLFGKRHIESRRDPAPVSILEVSQSERDTAKLEMPGSRFEARPICFVGIDLHFDEYTTKQQELDKAGLSNRSLNEHQRATKIILDEIRGANGCPKWVPYKPNLDPQWHLEDYQRQQLERASARRDRRSNWVFVFIGIVGLVLAGVQIWAQLQK